MTRAPPLPISVLYLHPPGAFGGASRSLLEMIRGFPENAVEPHLITQRGSVAEVMGHAGIKVIAAPGISQFDETRFNYYRGRRWLLLGRELVYLPFTAWVLLRARMRWRGIDLVHANELTALPAILLARLVFSRPVVVHVRSVQRGAHRDVRGWIIRWVLRRHAAAVIAIDRTVARSLPPGMEATVIHNAFTPEIQPEDERRPRFGDGSPEVSRLRVGMVGDFLAFKGVREFVESARICRDRGLNVEFVHIGGSARNRRGPIGSLLAVLGFLHDVEPEIRGYIAGHALEPCIRLAGFMSDISSAYRKLDLLCFPSHLNAVGRPVFEAAFWAIPSIVALRDPEPDTFVHGATGICIPPGDPAALADAIAYFHAQPGELRRMGNAARQLARETFDSSGNAARVLEVYRRVLGRPLQAANG